MLAFSVSGIFAQSTESVTISGYVRDANTGEELIGVPVVTKELPVKGALTNAYGFYSLTIPKGTYTILITYMGYSSDSIKVNLESSRTMDFSLEQSTIVLAEIQISSKSDDDNLTKINIGQEKLDMQEITKLPVIGGEKDILKAIQLLPGVKPANEAGAGFHVRGGSVGQNLILLDEATVYNPAHLMGFFSVFNSEAIKDVTLYKGNIPAEFGGRIASVLDVKMKEGNNQGFQAEGGIGLISSKVNLQGPIVKDKGSFMLSGRRTYADLWLRLEGGPVAENQLYFYDLNAKANYRVNENNRIFLSGYFGRDNLNLSNQYYLKWGNATGTFRWNHTFNDKLFSNTSMIYSNYNYQTANNPGGNIEYTNSKIQDFNLKQDFYYYPENGTIKFGLNSIYHKVNPVILTNEEGEETGENIEKYAWENALYASHELPVNNKLSIVYGLRLSLFSVLGPGDFYNLNEAGEIEDTVSYSNTTFVKNYFNLEPRLAANYRINKTTALKAAYIRTTQNMHMLSASSVSEPTDLWIPSSLHIKPEISDQFSLGYFRNFKENSYEFSTEVYYKILGNQLDLRDGAQLKSNTKVETEVVIGDGRGYGIEFLLKKKKGKLTGWLGYTLSRTERKFDQINNGSYFPAKQDRTHDISVVAIYEISKKWTVSANWVYYTGNAVTFPSGKYEVDGRILNYYTERNGYRMPDFHRLDIGATWQRKKTEKFESSWTFSLYNAYGRQNPFFITFRQSESNPAKTEIVQTSLFRWVPSFTYNVKFK